MLFNLQLNVGCHYKQIYKNNQGIFPIEKVSMRICELLTELKFR